MEHFEKLEKITLKNKTTNSMNLRKLKKEANLPILVNRRLPLPPSPCLPLLYTLKSQLLWVVSALLEINQEILDKPSKP